MDTRNLWILFMDIFHILYLQKTKIASALPTIDDVDIRYL